ncbi:hypothetical protein EKO27_g1408 [Xylaria grammica]|uniref:DUF3752 domain-containing protein n=1 Tax=Xylaria grammica TaxID=363999 RepID=A0A439DH05_9PEZI|nr:hypothetical protein EKO27_g1408 [Xylaria grammica]
MASIGPTLPPHLAKRKRTPDDEAPTGSPPAKIRASESAQTNKDEIELESESDSDDGYGPPAPKSTTRRPSIGPTAPPATSAGPSLPQKNAEEVALDGEDDEVIGPSAPLPSNKNNTRRPIGPALPSTNSDEISLSSRDEDEDEVGPAPPAPKRIQGPAPPPAALSERPPASADSESDSDDDDDYGPALPTSTSHQQRQAEALAAAEPKPQQPSAGGYRAADPTKLKARRFNSGPRANTGGSGGSEISSIWTETPEEKRKRLENAKEDAEHAARIQSFTEATRGRSLYEEHQAARARGDGQSRTGASKGWVDEEEDDPSKRAFDKEKDMKLGGRIGASQRRELVNKAADFGGRFAKGKYL